MAEGGAGGDAAVNSEGSSFDPYEHNEVHAAEWTKQWDHVCQKIVSVIGGDDYEAYVDGAHHVGRDRKGSIATVVSAGRPFGIFEGESLFPETDDTRPSYYRRIIKRER